jgi:hypothetical protein
MLATWHLPNGPDVMAEGAAVCNGRMHGIVERERVLP